MRSVLLKKRKNSQAIVNRLVDLGCPVSVIANYLSVKDQHIYQVKRGAVGLSSMKFERLQSLYDTYLQKEVSRQEMEDKLKERKSS
jgi:hypothetical protein|nr:MAG TPA: hypothetical protein [Caudoviricetes sp.]